MEYMDLVRKRRSIRRYKTIPVADGDIETVLEAARLAPSSSNSQCWQYVVVTDRSTKEKLAGPGRRWISEAPVVIAACADPKAYSRKPGMDYLVDIGISFEHLILAATDLGLGTCWIGAFDEEQAKEALGVPDEIRVVAFTPLGYPDERKEKVFARKPLRDICSYEKYGQRGPQGIHHEVAARIGKMYIKGRKLEEKLRNRFGI